MLMEGLSLSNRGKPDVASKPQQLARTGIRPTNQAEWRTCWHQGRYPLPARVSPDDRRGRALLRIMV